MSAARTDDEHRRRWQAVDWSAARYFADRVMADHPPPDPIDSVTYRACRDVLRVLAYLACQARPGRIDALPAGAVLGRALDPAAPFHITAELTRRSPTGPADPWNVVAASPAAYRVWLLDSAELACGQLPGLLVDQRRSGADVRQRPGGHGGRGRGRCARARRRHRSASRGRADRITWPDGGRGGGAVTIRAAAAPLRGSSCALLGRAAETSDGPTEE